MSRVHGKSLISLGDPRDHSHGDPDGQSAIAAMAVVQLGFAINSLPSIADLGVEMMRRIDYGKMMAGHKTDGWIYMGYLENQHRILICELCSPCFL